MSSEALWRTSLCAPGHRGPLCEVCTSDDASYSKGRDECVACPTNGAISLRGASLVCALAIFMALPTISRYFGGRKMTASKLLKQLSLNGKNQKGAGRRRGVLHVGGAGDGALLGAEGRGVASWGFSKRLVDYLRNYRLRVTAYLKDFGLVPQLKLLIAFAQIINVVPSIYLPRSPDVLGNWFNVVDFIAFNYASAVAPSACLHGYRGNLLVLGVAPLVALLLMVAVFWVAVASHHYYRRLEGHPRPRLLQLLPFCLFFSSFVCPTISSNVFSAWR